jgi:hypothetical protein
MYFIEKLKIEVPVADLIEEVHKHKLLFHQCYDQINIFEKNALQKGAVNVPVLSGKIEGKMVIFNTPVYDLTYPYPGRSKKLINFLKFLKKKYGGELKIKKG